MRRFFVLTFLGFFFVIAKAQSADELERGFAQPPSTAQPRTLWMWMNGNVTADGITRDLEAMQRVGLGGALIFNVGEYIPKGPVDYGRAAWLDLMMHATREADRLGLELAMHNCPGWSSSGGPWITPEMSMQRLVWSEAKIVGGQAVKMQLPQPFTRLNFYRDVRVIAFPSLPGEETAFAESLAEIRDGRGPVAKEILTDGDLRTTIQASPENPLVLEFVEPFEARAVSIFYTSGGGTISFTLEVSDDNKHFRPVVKLTPAAPRAIEDASLVETFGPVRARFFRITPSRARGVCEVLLHHAPRIPAWNYKANFSYRSARDAASSDDVAREFCIDPAAIIDLTDRMDARGNLNWQAPPGAWTILRFGHTSRAQENIAAPDAGVGLECDKMSRAATEFHFERGIEPLLKQLGPLTGKAFTGLEVDSYEVGVQNWTAGFDREFEKQNGYSLIRYLPTMTGRFVADAEISERFLWDLRRTQAELVAKYYYGELRELCHKHGMKLLVEPYGAGPGAYDELQAAGEADVPMGEFWAHFPWDDLLSIRLAASAAHVNGRSLVAGESFTSTEEQSRFLDHPYALKTTGDLAFSMGLNQMYFHRFAHQPHPSAVPGMTMGPWGFNFDRNNTWFEKSSSWLAYLARSQFLLQQGNFVADVLYFTGESSPQASKKIVPQLPRGYMFDAVNAEVLLRTAGVRDRRIVLGNGNAYRLLAFPPALKSMTPEVMRKIRDLVEQGAVIVGTKPQFSPTLRGYPQSDAELKQLATTLWENPAADAKTYGKGKVFAKGELATALTDLNVQPDFEFKGRRAGASLVWLHRRTATADIYFVANRQRRNEDVDCTFRVSGKSPEIWNPETGEVKGAAVYEFENGRTRLPLRLAPAESVFVVFRSESKPQKGRLQPAAFLQTDSQSGDAGVVSSFTLTAWINPGSDMTAMPRESGAVAENGKSWVVPVQNGALQRADMAGRVQAPVRFAAGRNGVIVAVQTGEKISALLVSRTPISGWTHVAVVCRDGKPALYLNGRLDREGVKTEVSLQPPMDHKPPSNKTVYYFDGDMTEPILIREALDEQSVAQLAGKGLPETELPSGIELWRSASGELEANVWTAGAHPIPGGSVIQVNEIAKPIEVRGPWKVSFAGLNAPDTTMLTNLIALQKLDDPAARFFSGTTTYRGSFELPASALNSSNRLWLDLGRVAVIAEVRLNGHELGQLWKEPFRLEITRAAREGQNELEIRVTNLLVNRLIGDEGLPNENEYDPKTRAIFGLPDWFRNGAPKPAGGRATFSTWKFFLPDDPLVESGLRGPVRVVTSVAVESDAP